jgi:hypothetical protein
MKLSVYLETTVISYLAAGMSENPTTALRQAVTRRWWEQERHRYDLFVSEAVENECRRGDPLQARKRLTLIEGATIAHAEQEHNGTSGKVGSPWRVA